MKIVIPFPYFKNGSGGIFNFCKEFSKEAVKHGHQIVIISSGGRGAPSEENRDGVRVIRIPFRHAKLLRRVHDYIFFGRAARKYIQKENPDIVLGISLAAYAGIGFPLVYRSADVPIPVEYEIWKKLVREKIAKKNILKKIFMPFDFMIQSKIEKKCIQKSEAFLFHSRELFSLFDKTYTMPTVPIYTPCSGVDTKIFSYSKKKREHIRKTLDVKEEEKVILFVGSISLKKGGFILEQAIKQVFNNVPSAKLLLVGVEQYTMNLYQYEKRVLRTGEIPPNKLPDYYSAADIFVLPTVWEGFPTNSILEAMSSSLPVICTEIPGVSEYLTNGQNSLLIPPYDHNALAEAITKCFENPKLAQSLGRNARESVLKFDWSIVCKDMLLFLEDIISKSK